MASDKSQTSDKDAAFEAKHSEELGFKRFAILQSLYILVPLATGAAAGALGYFTLGKPVSKLLPKLSKFGGNIESAIKTVKNATPEMKAEAIRLGQEGKSVQEIFTHMGFPPPEVPQSAKWIGAAVLGYLGAIVGGVGVGFDKWRKEESARLAADEINRDIAKLELFKPSDPELVAENKRLRKMLAEEPQTKINHAKHDGMTKHHETQQQLA